MLSVISVSLNMERHIELPLEEEEEDDDLLLYYYHKFKKDEAFSLDPFMMKSYARKVAKTI